MFDNDIENIKNNLPLKNCPFCGRDVSFIIGLDYFGIICGNCGLTMKDAIPEKLVNKWNKRFPPKDTHFITNYEINNLRDNIKNLEEFQEVINKNIDKIKLQHDSILNTLDDIMEEEDNV